MASIQTNEMKYMTWKEYEARPDAAIALCVGSVEQHGPHLPMSCDALIAYRFACALAETMDLIVAPELFFGYRSQPASGGGLHFPGTTSLSGETLIHLLDDILEDFYRQGRKRFVIVDGHYENQSFAAEAALTRTFLPLLDFAKAFLYAFSCFFDTFTDVTFDAVRLFFTRDFASFAEET